MKLVCVTLVIVINGSSLSGNSGDKASGKWDIGLWLKLLIGVNKIDNTNVTSNSKQDQNTSCFSFVKLLIMNQGQICGVVNITAHV